MIRDFRDAFGPEYELWQRGDPFIAEIVKADALITDHEDNYHWLGESAEEGHAIAARLAHWRLSFELNTLSRWYAMEED